MHFDSRNFENEVILIFKNKSMIRDMKRRSNADQQIFYLSNQTISQNQVDNAKIF